MGKNQQGVTHLILLLLVVIVVAAAFFIYKGLLKNSGGNLVKTSKQPSVTLQTKYDNPFDKNSQYVNPFSSYKNPFNDLNKR